MEHKTPYYRAEFKYKSGTKEVWQCKRYAEKGLAACTSPIVYKSEIDDIMHNVVNIVIQDKSKIIHDLVKIYSDISMKSSITKDISRLKVEINEILKMKNKLLDLSIKGKLSDDEFEARNNAFNDDIESLNEKIFKYEQQDAKNKDFATQVEALRKVIADELSFDDACKRRNC